MSKIKTLDEILAEMNNPTSAKNLAPKTFTHTPATPQSSLVAQDNTKAITSTTPIKAVNNLNPKHADNHQLTQLLSDVKKEPIYQNNKAVNRLRWLAFYYLSNRELSTKQLRQKLLDKDQDPKMVEALLVEFAKKGYQSDERCACMLVREGVRRGRGKKHIAHSIKKAGITLAYSIDEMIAKAGVDVLDDTILHTDDQTEQVAVSWLKLAVEARCKKYGNHLPKDQKDKARQLRFLQYRGFDNGVCFDALKYTLDTLDEID
ncbi:recombination regulator RecX [Moraxella nasovis]|uniref:regulatory protein RecX n=1 Tax=Moraxella nasovis TaxID=2904121 RepID=UPI001F61EC9D|nr:regulatory protein RecX [Moraxella nasovis]UNU73762.1 recombination regulator RecX [Moraxella nasovis]